MNRLAVCAALALFAAAAAADIYESLGIRRLVDPPAITLPAH